MPFCGTNGIQNLRLARTRLGFGEGTPGSFQGSSFLLRGRGSPGHRREPPHPAGSPTARLGSPVLPEPLAVCLPPSPMVWKNLAPADSCSFHVIETFLASSLALTGVGDWSPGPRWGPNSPLWRHLPLSISRLPPPGTTNHSAVIPVSSPAANQRFRSPLRQQGGSKIAPAPSPTGPHPRTWRCPPHVRIHPQLPSVAVCLVDTPGPPRSTREAVPCCSEPRSPPL